MSNYSLPPKTCSIERLVTIEKDKQKVLEGVKTATRRNGRYADIGEIMDINGQQFVVEKVYPQLLGEMTNDDAHKEGFADLDSYKKAILSIHPGMKWKNDQQVWVHEFKKI